MCLLRRLRRVEVELPKLSKCFLCLPLRGSLIAWGVLEAALSFFTMYMLLTSDLPKSMESTIIVFSIFLTTNGLFSIAIIYSVQKSSSQYLNYCYTYYALRWWTYASYKFVNFIFFIWYTLPFGCLCILIIGYHVLLIRSQILILGGTPRASISLSKCKRANKDPEKDVFEEENRIQRDIDKIFDLPPKYEEVIDDVAPIVIQVSLPQESTPTIAASDTKTVQQQPQQ